MLLWEAIIYMEAKDWVEAIVLLVVALVLLGICLGVGESANQMAERDDDARL